MIQSIKESKFIKSVDDFKKKLDENKNEKTILYLAFLILFSILCHFMPKVYFAPLVFTVILLVLFTNIYIFTVRTFNRESKADEKLNLYKFLKTRNIAFYRTYLNLNKNNFIISGFFLADLAIALKNLSLEAAGVYFAVSIFSKFVFIAYYHIENIYAQVKGENMREQIEDLFYAHINGIFSLFFVAFVLSFILSRFIVEVIFGSAFIIDHPSLPFVMLANMFLCVALIVYSTAKRLDPVSTRRILKVYLTIFLPIAAFISIGYVDTVTYFVVGSACVLSIFLYNFAIKKFEHISDTYSHLF